MIEPVCVRVCLCIRQVSTAHAERDQKSLSSLLFSSSQINQLNTLIILLIGNLSPGDRMKIMTICTIDVHARDVIAKMILAKVYCELNTVQYFVHGHV